MLPLNSNLSQLNLVYTCSNWTSSYQFPTKTDELYGLKDIFYYQQSKLNLKLYEVAIVTNKFVRCHTIKCLTKVFIITLFDRISLHEASYACMRPIYLGKQCSRCLADDKNSKNVASVVNLRRPLHHVGYLTKIALTMFSKLNVKALFCFFLR